MILQDFISLTDKGLFCPYGNFYLDPKEPVATAVISHAHADHAVSGNKKVYCTDPTAAFMKIRYGKHSVKEYQLLEYGRPIQINNITLTFLPAGHMLGSAMVLMDYLGIKYLYTGDFKLQSDNTCPSVKFCQANVLITESTFANPATSHPDAEVEICKLKDIKTNILLGAYGLGKAQRLIKLINDFVPQKNILVHHKIMPFCVVYDNAGYKLGKYQLYARKLMKEQKEYVYVVPPFTFDSYIRAKGVTRLFASGWKNLQVNEQDTLFISDHADWNEILTLVDHVKPEEIWTLHGDGSALKNYFADMIPVKIMN